MITYFHFMVQCKSLKSNGWDSRLPAYVTFKTLVQNQWEAEKSPFKWNSALNRDLSVELTFRG